MMCRIDLQGSRMGFSLCWLALALGCPQQGNTPPGSAAPVVGPAAIEPATEPANPIQLNEVAAIWGLNSTYQNGEDKGFYAILESLGGGVGLMDFDRDGATDLFIPRGGDFQPSKRPFGAPSQIFRQTTNSPHPQYHDVSVHTHAAEAPFYSHAACVTDYDNDGFDDVLLTGYGGLQLFHNTGDGTFVECSQTAGLTDTSWSSSAAWGDLNGDGADDLYVAHYANWSPTNDPPCYTHTNGPREVCPPREFQGLPDILYLSDGQGGFTTPGDAFGSVSAWKGLGVVMGDVDLDGDLDVYVTNDTDMNTLLVNLDHARLEDNAEASGTAYGDTGREDGSMGVDLGDFNGDGFPDIWVTNYENETFAMYRGYDGKFFQNVSRSTGISAAGGLSVGWGTAFADLDLDGDEDLFAVTGHVIRHPTNSPLLQRPLVLLNDQFRRFVDVAGESGTYTAATHMGRGMSMGDLDQDGDLDLAISHVNFPIAVLRNDSPRQGDCIEVELLGSRSSRWGVGAWIEVVKPDLSKLLRLKKGGGSYASTMERTIHAGLGNCPKLAKVLVHWPSGQIDTLENLPSNQHYTVLEGRGVVARRPVGKAAQ